MSASQCHFELLYVPGTTEQAQEALTQLQGLWLCHDPGSRPEAFAVSPRTVHAACHSNLFWTLFIFLRF